VSPREWDAPTYDALVLPHEQWGRGVLDRLPLSGDERVLDAGCGTGRDAALLRERHPGVHVVALDGSQRMLDVARDRLGDEAVTYVLADLSQPLPAEVGEVDAVLSVAAFHWVPDHDALFSHLATVLRPGGRLVSDSGGRGNIAAVTRAVAAVTGVPADDESFAFAGVDDTRERLGAAGFTAEEVLLRDDPFRIDDPAVLERFLATVVLGAHLAERPEAEHAAFVREVRLALPEPVVDYRRLEITATRR
jgi:trans-aconitate 2-methyltransferase